MRLTFFLIGLLFAETLLGQAKPDIFPEDLNSGETPVRCFCKPGVRNKSRSRGLDLAYTVLADGFYNDEEKSLTGPPTQINGWKQFELDLKAPVVNRDGFKFLVGYKYEFEKINVGKLGPDYTETFRALGKTTLKSSNLSAIFTKPLNEKNYIGLRLRYAANGNYGGMMSFDPEYAVYKILAAYGVKKHEDFEWGFGLNFSKSFRRTSLLPFIVYNRNFKNSWGIESAFPGYLFGRYNMNESTIALFGLEYGSSSYRMKFRTDVTDEPRDYALNHSELLFLMRLEQQFAPWVWGNLRFGYQMNFSTDFESKSATSTEFMVDPTNGLFFEIGVFISPPDRLSD